MNLKLLIPLVTLTLGLTSCKDNSADDSNIDCLSTNLQNGLIASYTFGNGSLNDAVAGNDLTNVGGAVTTSDRDGNASCAYEFNGQQSLTRLNPTFLNNLNAFSVSLWYHPIDTTRDGGAYEVLLSRGDIKQCPDRHGEWSISLFDCRQAVFGHNNSVWSSFSGMGLTCQEIINSQTGKWIHVVAVQNNGTYQIYQDGQLKNSASGNVVGCIPALQPSQDQGDLLLGVDYKGKIDDVFIYNRALSAAEVQTLFLADACCE
ncbi:MAG: LamG domain-containing protein [Saprospiraceae bacterium]|nr:LamG domain-containing protein [Saprospiraceae bacterium]